MVELGSGSISDEIVGTGSRRVENGEVGTDREGRGLEKVGNRSNEVEELVESCRRR